jgi:hypothetical protein
MQRHTCVEPVSWFSRKVTAREGHHPMTPGGLPVGSISLQNSPCRAECSMPCENGETTKSNTKDSFQLEWKWDIRDQCSHPITGQSKEVYQQSLVRLYLCCHIKCWWCTTSSIDPVDNALSVRICTQLRAITSANKTCLVIQPSDFAWHCGTPHNRW